MNEEGEDYGGRGCDRKISGGVEKGKDRKRVEIFKEN